MNFQADLLDAIMETFLYNIPKKLSQKASIASLSSLMDDCQTTFY